MKDRIIQLIPSLDQLKGDLRKRVIDSFREEKVEKGESVLEVGQVCNFVAFVEEGLFIFSKISEDGEEKVCDFAMENQWISQYQSMINKTASPIHIKALEEGVIHKIYFDDMQQMSKEMPEIELAFRKIIDPLLIAMVERSNDFQNLKAPERYQKFVQSNFELSQRVPQYYIASFLGIAPQSLSRIRKENLQ